MKMIWIDLAGVVLRCDLRYSNTALSFDSYLVDSQPESGRAKVTEQDWTFWERLGVLPTADIEFSSLSGSCSEVLLSRKRCLFHAVALRHRDLAWLIAAPSGVGKTTQLLTLQKLYPGEFSVICGDRPVLELRDDGSVYVHPSPWNGKEDYYGAPGAPLAGIISLRRGEEDCLEVMSTRDAVIPVYQGIIQTGETEDCIRNAAAFASELLSRTSVWRMTNRDVPGSTMLLYDTLFKGDTNEV